MTTPPFVSTPALLLGLALCLSAFLLAAALLVIAIVPAARGTVLRGLEALLHALVELVELVAPILRRQQPPGGNGDDGTPSPPD